MDADTILPTTAMAIVLAQIAGPVWLIARDQDNTQQRAIACIEAGQQFVNGDCLAGPTP
jgi:hypothetical protein